MKQVLAVLSAAAILLVGAVVNAQVSATYTTTGTVVTATDQSLVVDTPTGRMTLKLDSMLDRVRYNDLKPGTQIEFKHKTNDLGELVVTDVNTDPAYSNRSTTTYPDRTIAANSEDRYAADTLPQTASPLAILATLGAVALVVGATLRGRNSKKLKVVDKTPQA